MNILIQITILILISFLNFNFSHELKNENMHTKSRFQKVAHYLHSFFSLISGHVGMRSRNLSWGLGCLKVWGKLTRNCSLEAEVQSKQEVKTIFSPLLRIYDIKRGTTNCNILHIQQILIIIYCTLGTGCMWEQNNYPFSWSIQSSGKAQITNAITKWWRAWRKQMMPTDSNT